MSLSKLSSLSTRCVHLPALLRPIIKNTKWAQKPLDTSIIKALRLSGLGIGVGGTLVKRAFCKSKEVSKRADHLHREISHHSSSSSLTFGDLWRLIKPYLGWFLAAVACAILSAAVNIQIPMQLGDLVNVIADIIKDESKQFSNCLDQLQPHAVKLIGLYGAQAVLTFFYISFLTVMGERIANDLRNDLFQKLLRLDMSFYDVQRSGEISSRINVDIQEFKSSFKLCISQGLKTTAQTLGCVITLMTLSPKMTLYTLAVVPVIILGGTLVGAGLRSLSRRAQAQNAVASAVADEAFGNIKTVKAFAMEDAEVELFSRELERTSVLQQRLGIGIGLFQGGTSLFLNGIVLSVLYGGCKLIAQGEMTPGALMSFLVASQTIQRSLSQLSVIFGTAIKGWTAGGRVMEFLKLQPTYSHSDGVCIPYHTLWGDISFEQVDFTYPNRPQHKVFDSLSLEIPAGRVVALCGPSGEGKSTITYLLERFYEPSSGRITLDGKDLRMLNIEWLRGQVIGLISQEPVLFATSIEENIRYGRPEATDDEVYAAAKAANVEEFVNRFPGGYKTLVGERGTQLSGGQKQRIAIARAILKNPPILILDEATSALDSESERLVQEALNSVMKGRTVLIIAHRLSTIRSADLIYVIKDKQVAESGTHDQLMKNKNSLYKRLVDAQKIS